MQKILMMVLVLSTVLSSCKKDKDSAPAVDARDKFSGTWKGNINIVLPNIPPIPGGPDLTNIPTNVPVTYVYTKGQASNELSVTVTIDPSLQSFIQISNPLTATLSGSTYTYKEFNLTLQGLTVKCTGTGTINTDGKSITESGNWNYTFGISGTWSSALNKQP